MDGWTRWSERGDPRAGWAAVVLFAGAAFALSCRLDPEAVIGTGAGVSGVERALGGARSLLSAGLYERADQYFHKGVPHRRRAAYRDFFVRLRELVSPDAHLHAEGAEMAEVMPWLSLAARADERNVEAYNVAAYWLLKMGDDRESERVVAEAVSKNPRDYRPMVELARIRLFRGEFISAASAIDRGIALWPVPDTEESESARHDLSWFLDMRASLYEFQGRGSEAVACLRRGLSLFPARTNSLGRIARIESGELDPAGAERQLRNVFGGGKTVCAREEDEADHEHEHEHEH